MQNLRADSDSLQEANFTVFKEHTAMLSELLAEYKKYSQVVDNLKQRIKVVQDEQLPGLMAQLNLSTFTLDDGYTITRKTSYIPSITKDRMPEVLDYLRRTGQDSIVKKELRGLLSDDTDGDYLQKLVDSLKESGLDLTIKEAVHDQTLKAFVRRKMDGSDPDPEFPVDLFGVITRDYCEVKQK